MPAKNTVKVYIDDTFYHVYNRGQNKQEIFLEDSDYKVFIRLIKRYLSADREPRKVGSPYPTFINDVELHAYCLMPNHFHLLLFQKQNGGVTNLMRAVATSYSMYFNEKYERIGPLFQGKFKASPIYKDAYLHHISRYIHLNPSDYEEWPYSSLHFYMSDATPAWIKTAHILGLFNNDKRIYRDFISDYEDQKKILDELKYSLANDL